MSDIFGQEPEDYAVVRHLRSLPDEDYGNEWERHVAAHSQRFPAFQPGHHFRAMGSGRNDAVPCSLWAVRRHASESHTRATEDAQAVGFLTTNLLAIQTQVDEIMYTSYRLPMFISIDNSVAAGAQTWGVRVRDRTGRARRVTAPSYDAPMAGSSQTLDTIPVHYYGLDAAWSIDELTWRDDGRPRAGYGKHRSGRHGYLGAYGGRRLDRRSV